MRPLNTQRFHGKILCSCIVSNWIRKVSWKQYRTIFKTDCSFTSFSFVPILSTFPPKVTTAWRGNNARDDTSVAASKNTRRQKNWSRSHSNAPDCADRDRRATTPSCNGPLRHAERGVRNGSRDCHDLYSVRKRPPCWRRRQLFRKKRVYVVVKRGRVFARCERDVACRSGSNCRSLGFVNWRPEAYLCWGSRRVRMSNGHWKRVGESGKIIWLLF